MAAGAAFGSVASADIPRQLGPRAARPDSVLSLSRPTTTTRAPAATNALAAEKPSPLVPPITTMLLFASCRMLPVAELSSKRSRFVHPGMSTSLLHHALAHDLDPAPNPISLWLAKLSPLSPF